MCLDNGIMSDKKFWQPVDVRFFGSWVVFRCLLNVKRALKATDYVCLDWIWQDSCSLKQLSSWGWVLGFELIFLAAQEATRAYPMLCLFLLLFQGCAFMIPLEVPQPKGNFKALEESQKGKKKKKEKRAAWNWKFCISENGKFGKLRWWNLQNLTVLRPHGLSTCRIDFRS